MNRDRDVREKLVVRGAEALTDAELVSIVIHTGTASESSLELSENIISAGGSLLGLSRTEVGRLRNVAGMGIRRAAMLSASLELGKRMAREESTRSVVISSNEDVIRIFRPLISTLPHEEFWVLYLSSANSLLEKAKVSQGGPSGTAVDSKVIVKRAVELLASAIILVHNHPSGVASPSGDDKELTGKITSAAAMFDIRVLDHLIITAGECFSFRRQGML